MIRARHLRFLFLWRWWVCLRFAVDRIRVHPSALLGGAFTQFYFGRGVKIGARSRLSTSLNGTIVLGKRVWLSSDVEMETSNRISIGEGTTVQRRATINGSVTVGAGCIIAPNVFVSSGTHPFREFPEYSIREQERLITERDGSLESLDKPITIGEDCWLGVNVVVCPGVAIGRGCVIGANSVVVRDIPSNSICAGAPAKVIGDRFH